MHLCWHVRLPLLRCPVSSGCFRSLCHHGMVPGRAHAPVQELGPSMMLALAALLTFGPMQELDRCMKGLAALLCGKCHHRGHQALLLRLPPPLASVLVPHCRSWTGA